MGTRIARLGLCAMLLAALGPLCAQGAERVKGGNADPAAGVSVGSYHPSDKYILYSPPAGVRHSGGVMNWVYNDVNRPAQFTKAQAIASIQGGMAKWHAVCNITFSYQGETTTPFSIIPGGASTYDGVNVVGWDATTMTSPTTGITYVAWSTPANTFVDVEIRLNANYNPNLDATTVHEVGHAIGLDHSNLSGQVMSGTPNSPYSGLTSLQSDDIAGCVALYGTTGGTPPPDTQAPSVPTGLTATVVSSSAINLAWTASTDNVGVTGYKVFGNGTLLGTVTGAGASVTGLAASTTYSFTVSACDAAGNCSAQSAPVSATTQAAPDTQAPTVPTGLTATVVSSSAINLTWTASTDNVGVTGYKVYVNGTLRGTVSSAGASITSLSASTTYSFTVSACDAAGNCSAQSTAVSATTLAAAQPAGDYTGAWYNAGESGWGLSVIHGPLSGLYGIIMYHYNQSASPTWYWMSGGSFSGNTYSVPVSLYSGPYFGGTFNPSLVSSSVLGSATINFTSATTATISYTINGITVTKNIAKLDF